MGLETRYCGACPGWVSGWLGCLFGKFVEMVLYCLNDLVVFFFTKTNDDWFMKAIFGNIWFCSFLPQGGSTA